jgi:hypothetical protein
MVLVKLLKFKKIDAAECHKLRQNCSNAALCFGFEGSSAFGKFRLRSTLYTNQKALWHISSSTPCDCVCTCSSACHSLPLGTSWVLTARKKDIGTDWVGIKTLYNSRYKIFFKTSFLPFSLKEVSKTTSDKRKTNKKTLYGRRCQNRRNICDTQQIFTLKVVYQKNIYNTLTTLRVSKSSEVHFYVIFD